MKLADLVRRNLVYQWRGNLAVLCGIALGAAVLTGALLVGDSLRGSLRDLSLDQLGWVDEVLAPGRFFQASLADKLPSKRHTPTILLHGSVSMQPGDDAAARMNLWGVTADFWTTPPADQAFWSGDSAEVVLSEPLARDLKAKVGDRVYLNVQKTDAIPRESLLGKRKADEVLDLLAVTVKAIDSSDAMSRFALTPSPLPPRNAFVPLGYLQKQLKLAGKANVVLLDQTPDDFKIGSELTLADWGLKLTTPGERARAMVHFLDPRNDTNELKKLKWQGRVPDELAKMANDKGVLTESNILGFYRKHRRYLMLQSEHLYLDETVEAALRKTVDLNDAMFRPVLIYLADRLSAAGAQESYVTVAAVRQNAMPNAHPDDLKLRVRAFAGNSKNRKEDDLSGPIFLAEWPEGRLKPKEGDPVELEYYFPDASHQLVLKSKKFYFAGFKALKDEADDPDWTPDFPGLTDKLDIASWENPPFPPYSTKKVMERITSVDEDYWKRYRATPKAYITLEDGQAMWTTRFGKLTELRIDLPPETNPAKAAVVFEKELLRNLNASRGGFSLLPIRERALKASVGSSDFGGLFLGLSFFLIASALVLVGLLVRLNLERRASEIGLLSATGWGPSEIGKMFRREGWVLILIGAVVGLFVARWFAAGMLRLLAVKWPGEGTLQFLTLHETPTSYAIGFGAAALVSAGTLWWAFRMLRGLTPRELLSRSAGVSPALSLASTSSSSGTMDRRDARPTRRRSSLVLIVSIVGAVGALAATPFAPNHEALAGSFFGGGFFLLIALLTLAWRWLVGQPSEVVRNESGKLGSLPHSDPQPTLSRLGIRNAQRNPVRSLLTIGLLAAATFLIVAVQAFHREPTEDFFHDDGGSGGYRLFAQTDIPLYQNLADPAVRSELGMKDEVSDKILEVASLRVQPGDDASCLNLYKPLSPRLLGVPQSLIDKGRFSFASHLPMQTKQSTNPWSLLNDPTEDGAIPAIVDANSAMWILNVKLGGTLKVKNQAGQEVDLRIVGLLKESMFQSEILVSEASFLKLYPNQQGYQFFLIRCDAKDQDAVQRGLRSALAAQGVSVEPTFERLVAYFAVENMYLSTFQALGGLGLLLGALGLAIVLVRGVWERRAELALLRALGFRGTQLAYMILAENVVLLILGLGIGCVAALVAISPHLVGGEARIVIGDIVRLLRVVVAVGLVAGTLAVIGSLRTPVLTALRRE